MQIRPRSQFPAEHQFAQTNIQLLNQLLNNYTDSEVNEVRRAYELSCELFAGKSRDSGKPFISHLIGTSSILAWLNAPVELLNAGLLHAAYADGNFGSAISGASSSNRKKIRDVVGIQSEHIIFNYNRFAWRSPAAIPRLIQRFSGLSQTERSVVLVRLANELEEYLDLGILYCEDSGKRVAFGKIYGDYMVGLAANLGHQPLADLLSEAFRYVRLNESRITSFTTSGNSQLTLKTVFDETALKKKNKRLDKDHQPFPRDALQHSIYHRFEEQVSRYPENIAIDQAERALTYRQLHDQVNRVAHSLLSQFGSSTSQIITLCQHSLSMIVSALAILKVGKIWIPIDATHPAARLALIAKDSKAIGMLVDDEQIQLAHSIAEAGQAVVPLSNAIEEEFSEQTLPQVSPDEIACVIYTSGSTGIPKGVIHTHKNLLHLTLRGTNAFFITAHDRLSLLPSCSQIAGVTDFLRAILNGATLLPFDIRKNSIRSLSKWLKEKKISIYHSSPTLFRLLTETLEGNFLADVRIIHLGGEATLPVDVASFKRHFSEECILVNNFGCTELSGYCQFLMDSDFDPGQGVIPAGHATEDIKVSVHNGCGERLKAGQIGRIYVTSPYVALGYWRRRDETTSLFKQHQNGERTFQTSDLGYLQADGNLVFTGRKDGQVGVYGNRIDVAEIEAVLASHDSVKRVAVKAVENPQAMLTAFIVPEADRARSVRQLRDFAKNKLPLYMVPTLKFVDDLPLTPNGKIDLEQLDQLTEFDSDKKTEHVSPSSPTEKYLEQLWAKLLNVNDIGLEDDFFDLGGDSLLATRLINHIENEFRIRMSLQDVFQHTTLAGLTNIVFARYLGGECCSLSDSKRDILFSALVEIENLSEADARQLIKTERLSFT